MTKVPSWYFYANPMAALVRAYREIFVMQQVPELKPLIAVGLISVTLLLIGATVFERRREEFAELV